WQVDSGAPVEFYIKSFLRRAAAGDNSILFVSFSHSPQSIISRYVTDDLLPRFHLVDAFTSGFGKDDRFFADFYREPQSEALSITRVSQPADAEHLSKIMDRLAEQAGSRGHYVFDSPTAMLELWGGEERVLKFFSYLCPKLYDLATLAYWITEKHAHSPSFLAKLLHITQVVLELGVGESGIELTIRKAEDRPGCRIGVPYYFLSVDAGPDPEPRQREELEMRLLQRISRAVGSSLDLGVVFESIMQILARELNMKRGTLVLEDRADGTLRIAAAHGLSAQEKSRGVYQLGEGVTGAVVESGEPVAVPDIRQDARFLNRTGARRKDMGGPPISFICIPLRIEEEVIGALSIDRQFVDAEALERDQGLLRIVGSMISQAITINRMVAVEKEELLRAAGTPAAVESRYAAGEIVAASPNMRDVLALTQVVARSNATVLIQGETGTGKELIARVIHADSPRRDRTFVAVNCGALPDALLESELFGHVRGAFTGAVRDRAGRFELADGGTIFLDEVSSMSNQLQVKLLRVLQEKEFEPVGHSEAVKVDVRVLAATNVDLARKVAEGAFREDLFYRLNVVPIHLPPLRERRECIPLLLEHFMDVFNKANDKKITKLSREALDLLLAYDWPGNVRELENCIERSIVLTQTGTITAELLPEAIRVAHRRPQPEARVEPQEALLPLITHLRRSADGDLYDTVMSAVEKALIAHVLAAHDSVRTRAARELGLSRNTLRERIRRYGLD
ncbi:MAG: sigma 54-interacting transcriptional regulator, partial [Planctomycetota bacterium]